MFSSRKSSAPAAAVVAADPQFNYVTALLHGDGTNGAQNNTFLDSSTNNFTITRNGTPTQGSFSPYGSLWSNYFDGSSYLTAGTGSTTITGDFTIEFWFCAPTVASGYDFYFIDASNTINNFAIEATGNALRWVYSSSVVGTASFTPTAGTWYHVALVRSGSGTNNCTMYVNGTSLWQATKTGSINNAPGPWIVGAAGNGSNKYTGYISNLRIVNGSAVYTGNFTPSLTPLTAITNTYLLTCQSNRFVDNSGNNNTIAVGAGSPSVQRFNPFLPTSSQAYSTSVYGGSGYFGGSDYLEVASNAAFNLPADFTFECWFNSSNGGSISSLLVEVPTTNGLQIYFNGGILYVSAYGVTSIITYTYSVPSNTWTHLALVRNGTGTNNLVLYINGVSVASVTNNTSFAQGAFRLGGTSFYFTGYISNARLVKGTAVYTSNFTPPTAPLSAITNTSLLLSMTNAGIYDNAMMEDWITVGSAQVNTTTKKYGTGSMYFDGSGSYLSGPAFNVGMNPCSGDFTVEFWAYIPSLPGVERPIVASITSGGSGLLIGLGGGGNVNKIQFAIGNLSVGNPTVVDTVNFPVTTWTHVAAVRYNGTIYLYKNGTSVGTPTSATGTISQPTITVGAWPGASSVFNGYLDDVRITKGYARYTANFTPPTSALPNYGS